MQASTLRSVVIYGLVGAALLGAIVLGVQFAKNRSSQVAGNPQPNQTTQQPQPATEQSTPTASQPKPSNDNNTDNGSMLGTNVNQPTRVPATGPEDVLITTIGAVLLAFSSLIYFRSRRRLTTLV